MEDFLSTFPVDGKCRYALPMVPNTLLRVPHTASRFAPLLRYTGLRLRRVPCHASCLLRRRNRRQDTLLRLRPRRDWFCKALWCAYAAPHFRSQRSANILAPSIHYRISPPNAHCSSACPLRHSMRSPGTVPLRQASNQRRRRRCLLACRAAPHPSFTRSLRSLKRRLSPRSPQKASLCVRSSKTRHTLLPQWRSGVYGCIESISSSCAGLERLPQRRITLPSGNSGAGRLIPPCATPPRVGALVGLRSARSSHELRPPR